MKGWTFKMQGKKKKTTKTVTKPYLTGSLVDSGTVKNALAFLGFMLVMTILFLIIGAVMMLDNGLLRVIVNLVAIGTAYMMAYYSGLSGSASEVNQGEIMYKRRENGQEVTSEELARCFHPAKGFVRAFIGVSPFIVMAIILALTAQKQVSSIGVLPSWVAGVESREGIGAPLAFYHEAAGMTIETIARLITRMAIMPIVNIFNSNNADNMLLMERLSPIFVALPAVAYGLGYLGGVQVRTQIHTDIARSERRRRKGKKPSAAPIRAKKKQPIRKPKGPEQLN